MYRLSTCCTSLIVSIYVYSLEVALTLTFVPLVGAD